jgi:NAD(P)-dependent dehydrogenase (short-subunit alcohol dehydrogenase family)
MKERTVDTANVRLVWQGGPCLGCRQGHGQGDADGLEGLAVFLASDASIWITGAIIPMDGGNLAMNSGGSVGTEVFRE